ncbi:Aldo/keto reductase [Cenococcum geophilum]
MASAQKSALEVVLGAMTIGKPGAEMTRVTTLEATGALLDTFQAHGYTMVDTARIYGHGSSEEYLGAVGWEKRGLQIATKVYPSATKEQIRNLGTEHYTHKPEDVRTALMRSKAALKAEKLDLYYLHGPDRTTPFEETVREINKLYKEGHFERWGISNFMSWEVAEICELCKRNGWLMPSVYQGLYNALHRNVEPELVPCLRHYGLSLYVFNPLAGGFLTDRYQRDTKDEDVEAGSRFDPNRWQGRFTRARYWNEAYFDALDIVRPVAKKHGLTEAECALRWLSHHSQLKREFGDTVIIGASSAKQLEQNLVDLEKGALPEEVVQALDAAWPVVKPVASVYYH